MVKVEALREMCDTLEANITSLKTIVDSSKTSVVDGIERRNSHTYFGLPESIIEEMQVANTQISALKNKLNMSINNQA